MKRIALLLTLCLGLLLTGCATARDSSTTLAGLTIEEHVLVPEDQDGLTRVLEALMKRPEIAAKRRQWRDAPKTDGIALTFSPQEQMMVLHYPVKMGDSAVYARSNGLDVEVVENGKVLYTYRHPKADLVASPEFLVQGLSVWNGQWVLETLEEKVIVGGESLNDRLGYSGIFGFRMIADKPFFFFMQDGKVRLSYDGKVLSRSYDQVPHYRCCDSEVYNPRGGDQMVSFFGLRDGQWYYVDLGVYE